jgi:hypothetical protein
MFENFTTLLKMPFTFVGSTISSGLGGVASTIGGVFEGGIKGGLYAVVAGALGTIFSPTIIDLVRKSGATGWANTLERHFNKDFGSQMISAALAGGAVGGALGGAGAVAEHVQGGFSAAPAASGGGLLNGARMESHAHNAGHGIGSVVVAGAAAMAAVALYKSVTQNQVTGDAVRPATGMQNANTKVGGVVI